VVGVRWEVHYSPDALEWLKKADGPVSDAIVRKLESARENPHHYFERLVELPYYKLRVGDWRVIADLQEKIRIIAVLRIGHRKKVYREMATLL